MSRRAYFPLALLVLVVAALLHIWRLAALPPGPHYDEAANLLIARSVAFGGNNIFPIVEAFQGREALYYYLSAPLLRFVSDSRFSLQVLNVFASLVTIAATLSLGRLMFAGARGRLIGLSAGAFMALSFPLLLLGRQAFRAPMLPMMQALALLCLWRGLRSGRAGWLLAGGVLAGAAVYTYNSSRLFPVWLLIAALILLWLDSSRRRLRLRQGLLFFAALAITAAPMLIYALQRPDIFLNRLVEVTQPEQSISFAESLRRHILMFVSQGDPLLRYNPVGRPYFTLPEVLLLLLGLGMAIRRLRRPGPALERTAYALALLSPLMILPSVVSVGGFPPSHMRSIAMVPLVFVLLGLGVDALLDYRRLSVGTRHAVSGILRAHHAVPLQRAVFGIATLAFLIAALGLGQHYFAWAERADLYYQTDADLAAATDWIPAQVDADTRLYIAAVDRNHPTLAIADLPDYIPLGPDTLMLPPPDQAGLLVIPRSVSLRDDWAQLLTPYRLPDVPQAPDHRAAFLAYSIDNQLRLPFYVPPPERTHNGVVQLLGYRANPIIAGAEGDVELYWRVLNPPAQADLTPFVHVEDAQGTVLARSEIPLTQTERWLPGEVLLLRFRIAIPPGTIHGQYRIRATWVGRASDHYLNYINAAGGQRGIWADAGPIHVLRPIFFPEPEVLPIVNRQPADLAPGVRLLGWSGLPDTLRPGESIGLTLYWQALERSPDAAPLEASLYMEDESLSLGDPLASYPPSQWVDKELINLPLRWPIPPDLPGGVYTLALRGESTQIDLGQIEISDVARQMIPPPKIDALDIGLGDSLALYGYQISPSDESFDLHLIWTARDTVATDYTVFVHVIDSSGAIVMQRDVMPVENSYPTSLWIAGEYISDSHHFADLPPGEYALRVGLYDQSNGSRLPRADGSGDVINLDTVSIP